MVNRQSILVALTLIFFGDMAYGQSVGYGSVPSTQTTTTQTIDMDGDDVLETIVVQSQMPSGSFSSQSLYKKNQATVTLSIGYGQNIENYAVVLEVSGVQHHPYEVLVLPYKDAHYDAEIILVTHHFLKEMPYSGPELEYRVNRLYMKATHVQSRPFELAAHKVNTYKNSTTKEFITRAYYDLNQDYVADEIQTITQKIKNSPYKPQSAKLVVRFIDGQTGAMQSYQTDKRFAYEPAISKVIQKDDQCVLQTLGNKPLQKPFNAVHGKTYKPEQQKITWPHFFDCH